MDALGRPRVIGASMLLSAVKPAALRAGRMKRWPGIAAPVRAKHPRSSRRTSTIARHMAASRSAATARWSKAAQIPQQICPDSTFGATLLITTVSCRTRGKKYAARPRWLQSWASLHRFGSRSLIVPCRPIAQQNSHSCQTCSIAWRAFRPVAYLQPRQCQISRRG